MTELARYEAQGIHEFTSNVEVCVVDSVPAAGVFVADAAVAVEVLHAPRAFLMPGQARHLATLLMRAADEADALA